MNKVRILLTGCVAGLLLSACHVLPEPEQTRVYPLVAEAPGQQAVTFNGTLRLAQPTALQSLDVPRLVVLQQDGRQAYWQGLRLQDRLPLVVQENLVLGLGQSRVAEHVVTDSAGSSFDVELQTHIERFAIAMEGQQAQLVFRVQLRQASDRRVIASERFDVSSDVTDNQAPSAIAALESALSELQEALAQWLSETLAAR